MKRPWSLTPRDLHAIYWLREAQIGIMDEETIWASMFLALRQLGLNSEKAFRLVEVIEIYLPTGTPGEVALLKIAGPVFPPKYGGDLSMSSDDIENELVKGDEVPDIALLDRYQRVIEWSERYAIRGRVRPHYGPQ
jgi:hypothetical protein